MLYTIHNNFPSKLTHTSGLYSINVFFFFLKRQKKLLHSAAVAHKFTITKIIVQATAKKQTNKKRKKIQKWNCENRRLNIESLPFILTSQNYYYQINLKVNIDTGV